MNQLPDYFNDIREKFDHLSDADRLDVGRLLFNIARACELRLDKGIGKKSILNQLANYLERKVNEERTELNLERNGGHSFRSLRNDLVHGGTLNKYTEVERLSLEGQLWHALERSASKWDIDELRNFLSYCIPADRGTSASTPSGIIKFYRSAFSRLPRYDQERAFKELVLRIFSDTKLRDHLEPKG